LFELGATGFLSYLAVKYVAYAVWCGVAVRLFLPHDSPLRLGALWGGVRLAMGFGFGLFILAFVNELRMSQPQLENGWLYAAVYVPVRIVEWSILLFILSNPRGPEGRYTRPGRAVAWVVGGIVLSCLADAPLFAILGSFPVGRALCG
jgi:hypothetical protein